MTPALLILSLIGNALGVAPDGLVRTAASAQMGGLEATVPNARQISGLQASVRESVTGWAGEYCDKCDTNFGPIGQCDTCLTGWAGSNCDVCEFGFRRETGCSECIQNGLWTGTWLGGNMATVYLTFDGPTCTDVAPGIN